MTLNRFFAFFLVMSLIIYFGVSPYVIDQKKIQEIPQLEFESFTSYEIKGEHVNFIINGRSAKRFEDRLVLKNFVLHQESNHSIRSVSALDGVFQDKEILLENSVQYQGLEGMLLQTDSAKYNTKYNTLDIKVPFRLTQNNSVITGSSLFFNQNNDKMEAKDVKASLEIQ
jgi:hypothetical protein